MWGIITFIVIISIYYFVGNDFKFTRKLNNGNSKEISPSWNYESEMIGSQLIGTLVKVEETIGPSGLSFYVIKKRFCLNENELEGIWCGGNNNINPGIQKLGKLMSKIPIGNGVIITYLGLTRNKNGKNYYNFDVIKRKNWTPNSLTTDKWEYIGSVSDFYKKTKNKHSFGDEVSIKLININGMPTIFTHS